MIVLFTLSFMTCQNLSQSFENVPF